MWSARTLLYGLLENYFVVCWRILLCGLLEKCYMVCWRNVMWSVAELLGGLLQNYYVVCWRIIVVCGYANELTFKYHPLNNNI